MSIEKTKTNLQELIADDTNRVVALSGKWGTGKSYLWDSIKASNADEAVREALYVSLFGIKDISQLKIKLVQSAMTYSEGKSKIKQRVLDAWKLAEKGLKFINLKNSPSLDELALMAVPKMLNETFIVIDDIERKHRDLDVRQIMGFIDEYTKIHKARFLLILNSDELEDREAWETLREKSIDHELALETTREEAFEIAIKNYPSAYSKSIKDAARICSITNIRIIQKIIRVVNRLLSGHPSLNEEVLNRIIPSTVLLGAIHYKGMQDGPDFTYLQQFNSTLYLMEKHRKKSENREETDRDKLESKWAVILNELNIRETDEYEAEVISFLQSGLLETANIKTIFDRYVAEGEAFAAQQQCRDFFDKELWHPDLDEKDLLIEAQSLLPNVVWLDPYMLTALHQSLCNIGDGKEIADRMLEDWLANYRAKQDSTQKGRFDFDGILRRELHPAIADEFEARKAAANPLPSLLEVCVDVIKNSGWGDLEETAMRNSTLQQYEDEIRKLSGKDLQTFMIKSMEFYVNRATYEKHFAPAMQNFLMACRAICQKNDNPRRTQLIRKVFRNSNIEAELDGIQEAEAAQLPPSA
ncbi:hypothetical protein SAMN05192549_10424 [Duganella sacchari]|uniref:KAP family P-loop domain-containing protein n=1 Tax=Duganella sacchari TaxID=551987 RepID=A0A1M7NKB7_9BURK|nr:hypothetical protein [Duganella sacchari]SHN04319.1 hypothetical protein SAMN05192549_10424 [Duganella sacchari]